jgi:anti-sigma factor RsiW
MTRDDLEFLISQHLDGTLSEADRVALDERLANDADARDLLAEYRRLNDFLVTPPPAVNWDRLAEHLSSAVTEAAEADQPAVIGRIGQSTWTWRSRLAIAASIVIVASSGLLFYDAHRPALPGKVPGPTVGNSSMLVVGPQAETSAGPVVQQITIGPSPALAAQGDSWRYAEGVITRPSTATIAGAIGPERGGPHIR